MLFLAKTPRKKSGKKCSGWEIRIAVAACRSQQRAEVFHGQAHSVEDLAHVSDSDWGVVGYHNACKRMGAAKNHMASLCLVA